MDHDLMDEFFRRQMVIAGILILLGAILLTIGCI